MNIYQALDAKLRNASKGDKSRIQRCILLQSYDSELLYRNYNDRLDKILKEYWKNKMSFESMNFHDPSIVTYIINRWFAESRRIKQNLYNEIRCSSTDL